MREGIGGCLWCGRNYTRVVPNCVLSNEIRKNMPDAMAAMCLKCSKKVLVAREKPHGLRGMWWYYEDVMGKTYQAIFFADGGEMIVSEGEEVT